jgi:hypothetical protein
MLCNAAYDTVEKFTAWITGVPIGHMSGGFVGKPNDGSGGSGYTFTVTVTYGSNNNCFRMGGLVPGQSIQNDKRWELFSTADLCGIAREAAHALKRNEQIRDYP